MRIGELLLLRTSVAVQAGQVLIELLHLGGGPESMQNVTWLMRLVSFCHGRANWRRGRSACETWPCRRP